jgi:hypothetical protein
MDYRGWAILACAIAAPLADLSCQTPIDTLALKAHTYFLAHDRLAGRATGSDGAALAALYLASQCRALSLLPADSEYAQSVALEEATVGPGTTATVSLPDGPLAFRYPSDFTPSVGTRATLVNFGGPAVYVGAADQLDSLAGASTSGLRRPGVRTSRQCRVHGCAAVAWGCWRDPSRPRF